MPLGWDYGRDYGTSAGVLPLTTWSTSYPTMAMPFPSNRLTSSGGRGTEGTAFHHTWRRSRVGWSSCSKREFQKAAPKQMRRFVPEDTSAASGCSTEQSPKFAY